MRTAFANNANNSEHYYIPEILNFGDIMVLVWTPSPPQPPHAKACVSRNCDTNAFIQFIFDTAIDDLEWKNPIDFGEYRKTKMASAVWSVPCLCYFFEMRPF